MEPPSEEFQRQVERAKLLALKELAYGASHEINNPLANISARAQLLLRDEPDPERRRTLEAIDQQALRAHEMIADLMLFARPPQLRLESFAPAELAAEIARQVGRERLGRDIRLVLETDAAPPTIRADRAQLGAALQALVRNALEAVGDHGVVTVSAAVGPDARGLRLTVSDTGPGLGPRQQAHAFDPFFSGREAGRGLGFGLSKCWRIVTEHGGTVRLEQPPGGGARAVIDLPCPFPEDPPPLPENSPHGTHP